MLASVVSQHRRRITRMTSNAILTQYHYFVTKCNKFSKDPLMLVQVMLQIQLILATHHIVKTTWTMPTRITYISSTFWIRQDSVFQEEKPLQTKDKKMNAVSREHQARPNTYFSRSVLLKDYSDILSMQMLINWSIFSCKQSDDFPSDHCICGWN